MEAIKIKQYEYKFVRSKIKIGFDFDKKIVEAEMEWNALGLEGWKFCTWVNDAAVFMRETEVR